MKLILQEDVPNLGDVGEIVDVKPGYGRNYLIPQGLAVLADEGNVKRIEHEQKKIAQRLAKMKGSAEAAGKALQGVPVTLVRKVGEQDKLFGSVNPRDIQEALATEGHEVDRKQIRLREPIRALGVYEVPVKLHPEVVPTIRLWVVAE
jgi:large subunit ribosomal protein L9